MITKVGRWGGTWWINNTGARKEVCGCVGCYSQREIFSCFGAVVVHTREAICSPTYQAHTHHASGFIEGKGFLELQQVLDFCHCDCFFQELPRSGVKEIDSPVITLRICIYNLPTHLTGVFLWCSGLYKTDCR